MSICGIYKIVNNINGEYYIGSSVNIHTRWKQHCNFALNGSNKCPKLYNAIRKYGIDNFRIEILSTHSKEQLLVEEQKLLDIHVGNAKCYNISKFSDNPTRGRTLSEHHKLSLRKPKSVTNKMGRPKAIKLSLEHVEKIKNSLLGKKKTKQHAENISKSNIGKSKNYNGSRNGEKNPNSKLTSDQVLEIKKLFDPQYGKYTMYKKLASQFNVSWVTIRNVVEGITYGN